MKRELDALQQLAGLSLTGSASEQGLQEAASILRRAAVATKVAIVYAEDQDFLVRDDGEEGPPLEFSQNGLWLLQRQLVQASGPVGFDLRGHRLEEFAPAETGPCQFLASSIPFSGTSAEMCILRGPWEERAWVAALGFLGRALPGLAVLVSRFLNAERASRQRSQLTTLANAGQVLIHSEDAADALENMATALAAATGFDFITIDIYDASTKRFVSRALNEGRMSSGSLAQFWRDAFDPDNPDFRFVEAVRTRQPVLLPDMQNDERIPEPLRQFFQHALLRSSAVLPMLFQDEVLGVIAATSFTPRDFPDEEVRFLEGLASEVATALKAMHTHRQLAEAEKTLRGHAAELERLNQQLEGEVGERKRSEEALRASEERLRTVATNAPVVLFALDREGRFTLSEGKGLEALGLQPGELVGLSAFDVYRETPSIGDNIRHALAGEAFTACVEVSGSAFETHYAPVWDNRGEIAGVIGVATDVTERRRSEQELAHRLRIQSAVARTSSMLVAANDLDAGVNTALEILREAVGANRSYIFMLPDGNTGTDEIREWCAPDTEPELEGLQELNCAAFQWWMDKLRQNEAIIVPDVAQMPAEAVAEKEILEAQDVRSLLVVPLTLGSELAGFMGFDDTEGTRQWREEDVRLLRVASGSLSAFIARKRTEDALRESEAKYRSIFENVQDIFYRADAQGIITEISPSVERYGYTREEMIGTSVLDVYENPEERAALVKAVLERGEVVDYEIGLKTGYGWTSHTSVSTHVLRGPNGEFAGVEGALRDTNERKRAEELIRIQRDLAVALGAARSMEETLHLGLQAAIRASNADCGGVYLVDKPSEALDLAYHEGLPDDFIKSASHFAADSPNARLVMAGQSIYAQHHELSLPLDGPKLGEGLRAIAIIPVHHEGEVIACLNVASHTLDDVPLDCRDALETIAAQLGSAIARRRAQAALRESEQKYRGIFENVQDVFYRTDATGIITEISPSVERYGYKRQALIGTQMWDIYCSAEERSALLEAILEQGEVVDYEIRLKTADGQTVDTSESAHLLRDADGTLVGVEGALRDITERKRADEALLRQAERERELYRRQSEFVSTASHELRTPLHSIRGFTKLLLDGKVDDPETQHEFLTIVDEQSGQLTALVNDLLDVTRIEAGRMELQKEPLALHELVTRTITEFKTMAQEKAITIQTDLPPDLPYVEGDRGRLGQVLTNLVGNAIKFSDTEGTITIRASLEGVDLVVTVRDQGIGIPSEALPHLFDRFYQVDSSSTRPQGGTGLGLYISKQIVAAHGGRIWVDSKLSEGSTFSFTIPIGVSDSEDAETPKAA